MPTDYEKHMTPDAHTRRVMADMNARQAEMERDRIGGLRTAAIAFWLFMLLAFGSMTYTAASLWRWVMS